MEELLKFLSEHYTIPFYLVVWIVAMARYRTYFDTPLKYYPMYLMYTFLTEVLGYFVKYVDGIQFFSDERYNWHNVIIYNIYSVISMLFFYYVYWKVLKTKKYRDWVKYGAILVMLAYFVSVFFQNPLHYNLYYADMISAYILIFVIALYYKEKKVEDNPLPQSQNLMFWTSFGLVAFHLFFPLIFLAGYEAPRFYINYHLRDILLVLILIMYGSFMVGVIVHKRRAFR